MSARVAPTHVRCVKHEGHVHGMHVLLSLHVWSLPDPRICGAKPMTCLTALALGPTTFVMTRHHVPHWTGRCGPGVQPAQRVCTWIARTSNPAFCTTKPRGALHTKQWNNGRSTRRADNHFSCLMCMGPTWDPLLGTQIRRHVPRLMRYGHTVVNLCPLKNRLDIA